MICIVALLTCSILGIFSARYRSVAKEAFRCVFLRLTFRTCETKLDQRIKSTITSKLLKMSPRLAKFVYKRFELLSWIFTIVLFASLIYSAYSLYSLFVFGTCDPIGGSCVIGNGATVCE